MENDIQENKSDTKREPQNCWEFWGCAEELKTECSAFKGNLGKKCWLVSQFSKKNKTARKDIECVNCEWYKKLNPDKNTSKI